MAAGSGALRGPPEPRHQLLRRGRRGDALEAHLREHLGQQRRVRRRRLQHGGVERGDEARVAAAPHLRKQAEDLWDVLPAPALGEALGQDGAGELVWGQARAAHAAQQLPRLRHPAAPDGGVHRGVEGDRVWGHAPGAHLRERLEGARRIPALRVALDHRVVGHDVEDAWLFVLGLFDERGRLLDLVGGHARREDEVQDQTVPLHPALPHLPKERERGSPVLALGVHPQHRHVRSDGRRRHRGQDLEELHGSAELSDLGSEADQAAARYHGRLQSVLLQAVVGGERLPVLLLGRQLLHGDLVEVQAPLDVEADHVPDNPVDEARAARPHRALHHCRVELQRRVLGTPGRLLESRRAGRRHARLELRVEHEDPRCELHAVLLPDAADHLVEDGGRRGGILMQTRLLAVGTLRAASGRSRCTSRQDRAAFGCPLAAPGGPGAGGRGRGFGGKRRLRDARGLAVAFEKRPLLARERSHGHCAERGHRKDGQLHADRIPRRRGH
mmetsp:Transcript_61213/g.170917  ORF Transcript_61213/g.170917 Transcript_61213/m.170917 type:complete len:500 (+) Transcript_61213:90-1589(+)